MTTKTPSRKATLALGALMAFLAPRLAQDAKVDLFPALEGVDAKNFDEKKAAIADGVKAAVEGKLAQDASLDDLGALLDAVGGHGKGAGENGADAYDEPPAPAAAAPEAGAEGGGGPEKVCAFLKDKLTPEDYAAVEKMLGSKPAQDDTTPTVSANAGGSTPGQPHAMDETPEAKAAREKAEKDAAAAAKLAQDAAINTAVEKAVAEANVASEARHKAIRAAEKDIRPYVGEIAMDEMKSPADVYRAAFKVLGVEVKDVHESAFPALLKAQKVATIAQDGITHTAGDLKSYAERFPETARLGG